MRPGVTNLRPEPATLRNSPRRFRRAIAAATRTLGGEPLAPLRAPRGEDLAAAHRRKAGTEAMTALADELAGLIGALHVTDSGYDFPLKQARCIREPYW